MVGVGGVGGGERRHVKITSSKDSQFLFKSDRNESVRRS